MRVLCTGHSLSAERQKRFYRHFAEKFDIETILLAPKQWMNERTEYESKGNLTIVPISFFPSLRIKGFLDYLKEFDPDVIYINDELDYGTILQAAKYRRKFGYKLVLFSWENIMQPRGWEGISFDAYIGGCPGAVDVLKRKGCKPVYGPMLQAGVDCHLFRPYKKKKTYDTCTCAGWTVNKGVDLIEKAVRELKLSHLWMGYKRPYDKLPYEGFPEYGDISGWQPYRNLPKLYNSAKVHVLASRDTPQWKEQNAPYANLEALACGLSVVMTEAGDAPVMLKGCKAAIIVSPLKEKIKQGILKQLEEQPSDRDFVKLNYSVEVISYKLFRVLSTLGGG